MKNILGVLVCLIFNILILLCSSKLSFRNKEINRKIAHISIANCWFFFNIFFNNLYFNLVVPILMLVIMGLSYRYNIFKGVERKNQRHSYGTIYYFSSMILLLVISYSKYNSPIQLGLFFMPMGYGDGFAAIIGEKMNIGIYRIFYFRKSIAGNIAMLVITFFTVVIYSFIYNLGYSILQLILISFVSTVVEAISVRGTDNFTIPILTYTIFTFIS